jgi:hypothetical protein
MTRPIIAIFQAWMDADQACKIRHMTMRFSRPTSRIIPALLFLGVSALPASATDLQLTPPQKPANVIPLPKKPPRSHGIKIATIERLPSSNRTVARCIPLILGVAY